MGWFIMTEKFISMLEKIENGSNKTYLSESLNRACNKNFISFKEFIILKKLINEKFERTLI